MFKLVSIALLVLFMAACATPKAWHKPGSSAADLSAAQRDCRDRVLAEMRSDSFYRRERASQQFRGNQIANTGSELSARARLREAGSMKQRDALFLRCMRAKGYTRVDRSSAQ